jgi:hypothetical protein
MTSTRSLWSIALSVVMCCSCVTGAHDREDASSAALRSLCSLKEIRGASRVGVVSRTAMVAQLGGLEQLVTKRPVSVDDVARLTAAEERLVRDFVAGPIIPPRDAPCKWVLRASREPYTPDLLVELSNVIPAGIAGNATPGIFARVSAGGRPGADFYWIAIRLRADGAVVAETPVALMVSDG